MGMKPSLSLPKTLHISRNLFIFFNKIGFRSFPQNSKIHFFPNLDQRFVCCWLLWKWVYLWSRRRRRASPVSKQQSRTMTAGCVISCHTYVARMHAPRRGSACAHACFMYIHFIHTAHPEQVLSDMLFSRKFELFCNSNYFLQIRTIFCKFELFFANSNYFLQIRTIFCTKSTYLLR
jgi:hypothetical protein